jgi:hypothetical protein
METWPTLVALISGAGGVSIRPQYGHNFVKLKIKQKRASSVFTTLPEFKTDPRPAPAVARL